MHEYNESESERNEENQRRCVNGQGGSGAGSAIFYSISSIAMDAMDASREGGIWGQLAIIFPLSTSLQYEFIRLYAVCS